MTANGSARTDAASDAADAAGVLDAHVHVWRPSALTYPWLASAPALRSDLGPADVDDADGWIREWVFVEADAVLPQALDEVAWVAGLDWPGLRAIVAHADLADPRIPDHLDALAAHPLVRGVRHSLQGAPTGVISSAAFLAGLVAVGERGLAFDACVRWPQLEALADAVARAPGTRVVLDHLGKPPVADGLGSPEGRRWRAAVERIADLPHVSVKLSGLPAEAASADVLAANGPDLLRCAFDAFGPERAMFGGDWPVSGVPGAGVPVSHALAQVRAVVPVPDHPRVMGATARAFYGIQDR